MKKRISIKDIAQLTNTSITTVSFVLNGKGRISEPIRKKILQVAIDNGYEPNLMAVGLRTGVSKVIGLVVESIGGEFFGAVAKAIEHEAEVAGYRILYCSTNNNLKKGRDVIKMLSQQMVDGYIITPMNGLEDEIAELIENDKPVVLIDGHYPGLNIPYVSVDNFNASFTAVQHLAEAGYKEIGLVTVDLELIQLQERMQGFEAALEISDLKNDHHKILKLPFDADAATAVKAITSFIRKNRQMDAVFFTTNYLGTLGLQCIKELDLKIPDDLAVMSFDDDLLFGLYPPGITSIQQPTYELAKSAIDILFAKLNDKDFDISQIKLQLPAKLIKRDSTKSKVGIQID